MATRYVPLKRSRKVHYRFDLFDYLAECDANYLRLVNLLYSNLSRSLQSTEYVIQKSNSTIEFDVLRPSRYVSIVTVTQRIPVSLPDLMMEVRMFHDVQCAEVVTFQGNETYLARYTTGDPSSRTPDEKSQINRFLGELLNWCINKGEARS
ncbi:MAG: DUF1249 domain-containing protein [Gammaproteobacteria bacterium]|nr:DUF1249 domain-containing protein [Gammaproteobacteria bacterium]MDE0251372.1 DUF1249 domain-containing protein [Gammaproteobacteria bacterium]MDE0401944.1 DUF1249 domain-containing protein [Gammaproteobacteria bacterium]